MSDRQSAVMFHTQRGKWGMASFTSTRAIGKLPIPGQKSYAPASNTNYMYEQQPEEAHLPPVAAAVATTPKPRKFFKSRTASNSTTTTPEVAVVQQENHQQQQQAEPIAPPKPVKVKHSKKKTTAIQEYFTVPETPLPPPPPPATIHPTHSEPAAAPSETIPSKRYLARARKVQVNYNEDESSLPPPPSSSSTNIHIIPITPTTIPISAVSPSMEHPPIKLRISKGTARLVSTDSEEANNASPPHQTFASPSLANGLRENTTTTTTTITTIVPLTPPPPAIKAAKGKTTPKSVAPIRTPPTTTSPRKRRTAAVKTPSPVVSNASDAAGEPRRTTRAKRRQQEEEELRSEQEQTACEEEEQSEQSVHEEVQVKEVQVKKVPPKEDPVPVVVAAPVAAAAVEPETVAQKPPPGRRGRKPKVVKQIVPEPAVEPPTPEPEPVAEMGTPKKMKISQPESPSPRRSTRGGATPQVTPTKVAEPEEEKKQEEPRTGTVPPNIPMEIAPPAAVRNYGRKRKGTGATSVIATPPVEEKPSPVKGAVGRARKVVNGKEEKNKSEIKIPETVVTQPPVTTQMEVEVNNADKDCDSMEEKPLAKLVISKKKGSIFKSRALVSDEEVAKNRPVYKHKWDVGAGEEDRNSPKGGASQAGDSSSSQSNNKAKSTTTAFDGDFDESPPAKTSGGGGGGGNQPPTTSSAIFKPHRRALLESGNSYSSAGDRAVQQSTTPREPRNAFYTVKQAHQIQEIGEFQEMDDDVEYILDTLQPKYPILTRCLSAMQLASKCMTPEFRMHVRAHGTVTQFFRVLQDAPKDRSLGLCTAAILFVLSQDNIGIDLDKESLELMLNLLECDEISAAAAALPSGDDLGLTEQQAERNKMKVRELCEEVKGQGKAQHLNVDNITVGALAMETLLSLTSQRAGEWIKEELRTLGGLEHLVKTICECCRQISDYVAVWTEGLLERLRRIGRCVRVLDNVMEMNEQNQKYILTYDEGRAINVLVKLYKLCDTELALYPTTAGTPKDDPGVVIREALMPTVKVLVSLTHPFNEEAHGARIVGEKTGIFDTSLHLLFHSSNYVPEDVVFDLSVLVELLLMNLTMHTTVNRVAIMEANALSDFSSRFAKVPAIKALVEFFYKCEEAARLAEQNADEILDAKPKKKARGGGNDVEETVTKVVQTAGNHMEQTVMAGYAALLIGQLVMHNEEHRKRIREFMRPESRFGFMGKIVEKYYNFMLLTATSTQSSTEHVQSTKKIMDYLLELDAMG